jgi:hypothetical protein
MQVMSILKGQCLILPLPTIMDMLRKMLLLPQVNQHQILPELIQDARKHTNIIIGEHLP